LPGQTYDRAGVAAAQVLKMDQIDTMKTTCIEATSMEDDDSARQCSQIEADMMMASWIESGTKLTLHVRSDDSGLKHKDGTGGGG